MNLRELESLARPGDDLLKALAAYIRGLDTQSRRRLLALVANPKPPPHDDLGKRRRSKIAPLT